MMAGLRPRRLLAVTRTEWTHLRRDARSLGVIVLQPLVLLIIYGYAVNFDLKDIAVAVCDYDHTPASRALIRDIDHSQYFNITHRLTDQREATALLDRSLVRLAVIVPAGYAVDIDRGRRARLLLLVDGADSNTATIAIGYTDALLTLHAARVIGEFAQRRGLDPRRPRIQVATRVFYNPALSSTRFIVPGLIAVILAMLSALLTSGTVVREREQGTIELLLSSPLRPSELLLGKLTPYVLVSLGNTGLVVVTGRWLFGIWPAGDLLLLFALILLVLPTMLGIGLLASSVARTQQTALVGAFVVTVLPSLLLSGFVFPRQNMPLLLQWISNLVPATHLLIIIRGIYLKGVGLSVLWPQVLILTLMALAIITISARAFRRQVV